MAQVINTNVMSLNAQRNLAASQTSLATAMQRLSSGLRINSAKDDAAGLAISERFTTQIRGLNQAARNANDGISLSQTAEGALGTMTDNLQRIRELAVQSANSTNSTSDRAALDQEVQQRLAEIQRIASQTSFNGQKILDGTFGTASFQVGANVGETISLNLSTSMKTSSIGKVATSTGSAAVAVAAGTAQTSGAFTATTIKANLEDYSGVDSNPIDQTTNAVTINGIKVANSASYTVADTANTRQQDSAYAKAAAINASNINGITATATTTQTLAQVGTGLMVDGGTSLAAGDTLGYGLKINGVTVIDATTQGLMTSTDQSITIDEAVSYINLKSGDTGVIASKAANGDLVLTAADGRNIVTQESWTFTDGATGASNSSGAYNSVFGSATITDDTTPSDDSATVTQTANTVRGQITLTSNADITISSGLAVIGFGSGTIAATGSLEGQNVLSVTAANTAIQSVDSALTSVSALRSTFGAIQNRFESTIANLAVTAENTTASRSRIMDADFAVETANLSRSQILQQAGTAMVAQANQVPQAVLQLLK
jgi:flagellin